jgi:hypothetical protein
MNRNIQALAAGIALLAITTASQGALGQKQGGILRLYHFEGVMSELVSKGVHSKGVHPGGPGGRGMGRNRGSTPSTGFRP